MPFIKPNLHIILIVFCVFVLSIGCSPRDVRPPVAEQPVQDRQPEPTIITDFTTINAPVMSQVGDFVIRDDTLEAFTGWRAEIVEIPADLGIRRIGRNAFAHAWGVVSIFIPEGIKYIEDFPNIYTLQSIIVDPNNEHFASVDGVLFNRDITEMLHFPRAISGDYTIPDGVESINWGFFFNSNGLTSITIPASVISITGIVHWDVYSGRYGPGWGVIRGYGYRSFERVVRLPKLASITVDNDNEHFVSLDGVLFNRNKTEILFFPRGRTGSFTMPYGVTDIGDNLFSGSNGLASITIPNSVTRIGDHAFTRTGLTTVAIPDSVTSIGAYAFAGNRVLFSVTIPDSVTSIGQNVFLGCTILTSITVDPNNSNFASYDGALFNRAMTELIHFPRGRRGSFAIPYGVTSIAANAFSGSAGLNAVTIPDSVTTIGVGAFSETNLTAVFIPSSVTTIGQAAFSGCRILTSITVDPNNTSFASYDGVLFNRDKTELIYFPRGRTGSFAIPYGTITVGNDAFSGSIGLTAVTIPDSVTTIGEHAFAGTGLTSVIIPNSVTRLAWNAFEFTRNLYRGELPDHVVMFGDDYGKGGRPFWGSTGFQEYIVSANNPSFTTVDGVLFNRDKTKLVSFPQGRSGHFSIPDTVTTIGYKAFYDRIGLTSVNIPASVTNIGDFAFSGSGLVSVVIPEGVTSIGRNAFSRNESLTSVWISASVNYIGAFAFNRCPNLQHFILDQNNRNFVMANGVLFSNNGVFISNFNTGYGDSLLAAADIR